MKRSQGSPRKSIPDRSRARGALVPAAWGGVLLLLAALAWTDLWAADIWWQMATGRRIVEQGAVPREDPFSWMTEGREWIEPRWGYEALLYLLFRAAGPAGTVVAKAIVLAAAFVLAARAVPARRAAGVSLAVLALGVVAASDRFRVRPEVLSYLLFAFFLFALERARRRPRWLLALPPAAVLWANVHSISLLAPVLVGIYAAGELGDRFRRRIAGRPRGRDRLLVLALAALACAAALFANPYGYKAAVELPWRLFREIRAGHVYAEEITEFWPPWRHSGHYLWAYWTMLAAAGLLVAAAIRRLRTAHVLAFAAFAYLSIEAVRNIPLLVLVAIPVANAALAGFRVPRLRIPRRADRALLGSIPVVSLGLVFLVATDCWYVSEGSTRRFGCGVSEYQFPIHATQFLKERGIPGRGFSGEADASYLIWSGFPVFTDGRLELHDVADFETALAIGRGERNLEEELPDVSWCLVNLAAHQPLVTRLEHPDSPWVFAYVDGVSAVYVRRDLELAAPLPVEALDAARAECPGTFWRASDPVLSRRLGWFYFRRGDPERAIEFFSRADGVRPLDPRSLLEWGEMHVERNRRAGAREDLEAAEGIFRRAAREAPQAPEPHRWLAGLALQLRDDREEAIRELREYERLGGRDAQTLQLLRELEKRRAK
ncbi:MAG: hypothetical protein HY720_08515 [Planctomycetes bacterium]|nr:hypothetical protein [Planctomycetota bacterium]